MKIIEAVEELASQLAGFVAWDGEENGIQISERLARAESLLRKLAPEILKRERDKVKAFQKGSV